MLAVARTQSDSTWTATSCSPLFLLKGKKGCLVDRVCVGVTSGTLWLPRTWSCEPAARSKTEAGGSPGTGWAPETTFPSTSSPSRTATPSTSERKARRATATCFQGRWEPSFRSFGLHHQRFSTTLFASVLIILGQRL